MTHTTHTFLPLKIRRGKNEDGDDGYLVYVYNARMFEHWYAHAWFPTLYDAMVDVKRESDYNILSTLGYIVRLLDSYGNTVYLLRNAKYAVCCKTNTITGRNEFCVTQMHWCANECCVGEYYSVELYSSEFCEHLSECEKILDDCIIHDDDIMIKRP